jgi:hypothetical protein
METRPSGQDVASGEPKSEYWIPGRRMVGAHRESHAGRARLLVVASARSTPGGAGCGCDRGSKGLWPASPSLRRWAGILRASLATRFAACEDAGSAFVDRSEEFKAVTVWLLAVEAAHSGEVLIDEDGCACGAQTGRPRRLGHTPAGQDAPCAPGREVVIPGAARCHGPGTSSRPSEHRRLERHCGLLEDVVLSLLSPRGDIGLTTHLVARKLTLHYRVAP